MEKKKLYSARMQKYTEKYSNLFAGYLTAGYPDVESFNSVVKRCSEEGMQILEVGFPSRNPYDDGEVIQKAHSKVDIDLCTKISFWKNLRKELDIPIWVMGYREDLIETGFYKELARDRLVDVLVIPRMDFQERLKLRDELKLMNVDVMGFVDTASSFGEITRTLQEFTLIYQKLYSGPTGVKNESDDYKDLLSYEKVLHNNIVFAGFGISTPERVEELLKKGFDGAIIGTELLKKLNQSPEDMYAFIRKVSKVVEEAEPYVHCDL